ncbi:hypothetical protein LTS18_009200, partial [Coniosporium uncinatum]
MSRSHSNSAQRSYQTLDDSHLHRNPNGGIYTNPGMAQRSVDSLLLGGMNNPGSTPFASQNLHLYSQPTTGITDSQFNPSTTLPLQSPTQEQWPWSSEFPTTGFGDTTASPAETYFNADDPWGIPSAGTMPSFSPADLPLHPDKFSAGPTTQRPISHCGESNIQSAPALTAPSSGTQSEAGGEPALFIDNAGHSTNWTDLLAHRNRPEDYRLSTSYGDSLTRPPPTSTPNSDNRHSFNVNMLRRNDKGSFTPHGLPASGNMQPLDLSFLDDLASSAQNTETNVDTFQSLIIPEEPYASEATVATQNFSPLHYDAPDARP